IYFWVLKPAAKGYMAVVPEGARVSVGNFISNATSPIRFANCLLQLNFKGAGKELARLLLNSTFGVAGLFDVSKDVFHISKQDEDFGQTLGFWGLKPIFFIEWPLFGPSSLRDTVGMTGDSFFDPHSYFLRSYSAYFGVTVFEKVNQTSLTIGVYEDLIQAALDPYVAVRDAYFQYRENKIKER
ncbi:MAG: VacJ family lipoprotein, partial [Candidatus Tectomicrobia bacterium]|nr:VacJ family lipoprotein [Candidatus Tectomicrobia bacterium]